MVGISILFISNQINPNLPNKNFWFLFWIRLVSD